MMNEQADNNSGTQKLQLQYDWLSVHSSRNEDARKECARKIGTRNRLKNL